MDGRVFICKRPIYAGTAYRDEGGLVGARLLDPCLAAHTMSTLYYGTPPASSAPAKQHILSNTSTGILNPRNQTK